jgi:glycosyltransferase involved in cell wall biosynthesis
MDPAKKGKQVAREQLRILQVNTEDISGGAALVAWNLFQSYRARGHQSWLAVAHKYSNDPDVLPFADNPSTPVSGAGWKAWLTQRAVLLAHPGKLLDGYCGFEDFRFPKTWTLLQQTPQQPDIVHCHNLHGGYFDLRTLPWLSRQLPLMLTLHDAWMLSGHCAHSVSCERWKTGCGRCPDLTLYPAIQRDATAYNWRRKQRMYAKSKIYIATPSQWLMHKVEQSMLAPAVAEARVIPNGVDMAVFHPGDKQSDRVWLGIPPTAKVLLFTAKAVRQNLWKDYATLRTAVEIIAERLEGQKLLFIALGEDAPPERIGRAEVCFVPYQSEPEVVARYYRAADAYIHAARADTFPNTVLEALACGTPVVATMVGGIPEQIEDRRTGFLVPAGDAQALAARVLNILTDAACLQALGEQAATVAQQRFNSSRQTDAYLAWYNELVHQQPLERLGRSAWTAQI